MSNRKLRFLSLYSISSAYATTNIHHTYFPYTIYQVYDFHNIMHISHIFIHQNAQWMHDLNTYPSSPRYLYTKALIPSCDAPISKGLIDNPSTRRISVLGRLVPKSWYQTSTNYPWTSSYSAPLPYVLSPRPIHSYLNLKYEKKMNNYSS